jgi:hypothetical protein
MKIDTSGSVFANTVGYVKYPSSETMMFEVTDNVGVSFVELEVLAKNIESEELYRSWRPVLRLQDGDKVNIVGSIITEPGTLHRDAHAVHTVQMPPTGTGWVSASAIVRATPEQLLTYYDTTAESEIVATEPTVPVAGEMVGEPTEPEPLGPLTLVELEAAWEKISSEPVMGAEVMPLKDMYSELLLDSGGDLVIEQIAGGRIKQLDVWAGLQNQRVRIELLKASLVEQTDEAKEYRSAMTMYTQYAVSGKLALSNTFDGRLRPFMYRIQDTNSGRTLGYLPLNDDWDLSGLIGQSIGVVGDNKWNPNWSVHVVEGSRFDILSPTTATVTPDIQ